ncbi:protein-L-isoaspartate O-methyltransferase family protein [Brachybacterium sacelli]|uniref:Protein-L-isoaspartate O-methyltransferase n=1 Tax=Brachybacterium sacelli TaxID=173364 RepID=A0ABS4X441_9MICO|nr:methyltransferase domain-containing protein [Brachybacterium sacelli]MBP2383233.1 protein-L-isoaspartate(D-aspartate) O-methyltransferase [Brachybacterium sacelli]
MARDDSGHDDDPVAGAFAAVPRTPFLPAEQRRHAEVDAPLRIAQGQTNSQPTTVEIMLRLLEVRPGDRVLDVGAGSGWTTALLAHLAGPRGRVIGVERHEALVESARAALGEAEAFGVAEVRVAADGVLGAPEDGPYDRILVSAEAQGLPDALIEQLADGGVMVIPVGTTMHRIERHGDQLRDTEHGAFRFVPLVED